MNKALVHCIFRPQHSLYPLGALRRVGQGATSNQHQAAGALACARRCSGIAAMVSTMVATGPITGKHDVVHKTLCVHKKSQRSQGRVDRATAISNTHA